MAVMPRAVALLGGINVGGHRVTMQRLRAEFEALGFEDVTTLIASGNVLFTETSGLTPTTHEPRIAAHLGAQLGFPVPTFVRDAAAVHTAAALLPFGPVPEGYTHMVAFCRTPADRSVEDAGTERDRFVVHGSEVHWLIHGGVSTSGITMPKLAKLIGPNTTRNVTTVQKLATLLND